jgi:O-succinylbenzoic acid--CoA ligase
MAEAWLIDFASSGTEVLINPRAPEDVRARLEGLVASSPALDAHIWIASSGSGGALRMIALSKVAIIASAHAVNVHLEANDHDRWCCPLPLFHVGGLGILARARSSGCAVEMLDDWSAEGFIRLVASRDVTLTSLVPSQLHDLVRSGSPAAPSLRAIVIGGSALAPDLYARAKALGWNVLPSYGMTECCSQIATAPLASIDGDEFPGLELLSHLSARQDPDGRLAFSGTSLLTGFATETAGFVDPKNGGWFVSEDFGSVRDVEGRTIVVPEGRATDFVKIGGELVSLARLDQILASIAPFDAAVIPVPDERLGTVIHLVVSDPSLARSVQERFDESVFPYERPRAVHIAPIPRSPLGKLLREELLRSLGYDRR